VVAALPALEHDQNLLRQWTSRVVSEVAPVCFVSSLRGIVFPEISDADLLEEKRITPPPAADGCRVSFGPKILDDDLPSLMGLESDSSQSSGLVPVSFSMDFREVESAFGKGDPELEPLDPWKRAMSKSKSADFHFTESWDMFGDEFHF
jgi:hypothetical protein